MPINFLPELTFGRDGIDRTHQGAIADGTADPGAALQYECQSLFARTGHRNSSYGDGLTGCIFISNPLGLFDSAMPFESAMPRDSKFLPGRDSARQANETAERAAILNLLSRIFIVLFQNIDGGQPIETRREAPRKGNDRASSRRSAADRVRQQASDAQDVSDKSNALARASRRVADEMNRTGLCATGVQRALSRAGMPEFTGKFHGWQARQALLASGKFEEVPISQMKEGDIVCRQSANWRRDRNAPYGHVAVITGRDGNGFIESSDHTKRFDPDSKMYDRTVVLRLKA